MVCPLQVWAVDWQLWPGAEDKALRGRNLSAVSRTLYRQAGEADAGLPACAEPWRVENQSDKSNPPTLDPLSLAEDAPKNLFLKNKIQYQQISRNRVSIFCGQVQTSLLKAALHEGPFLNDGAIYCNLAVVFGRVGAWTIFER
jgi:hypothetical protein